MTTPPPVAWTPPTPEEIEQRSDEMGLDLSPEMMQVCIDMAPGFPPLYEAVSEWWRHSVQPPPTITYAAGSDPWNAAQWTFNLPPTARGTLDGLNLVVKENVAIAGIPLGYGSALVEGHIPRRSATVVNRMLAAGAAITHTGKADNLGLAITGDQNYTGPVLNPWNTDYLTWGSSSGAAALIAAGEVDAGILVDQAGSGRMPSAGTGLACLMPSRGMIPFTGILGFTAVQDRVAFASRDVRTVARLASAASGDDPYDLKGGLYTPAQNWMNGLTSGVQGMTIGVVTESMDPEICHPGIAEAIEDQARQLCHLGARVREVSIPEYALAVPVALVLSVHAGVPDLLRYNLGHMASVLGGDPELVEQFDTRRASNPEDLAKTVQVSAAVVGFDGGQPPGWWTAAAMEQLPKLHDAYNRHFSGPDPVDLLLTPTAPSPPPEVLPPGTPLIDELGRALGEGITHTCAANLTGLPAGQVPLAPVEGLPVGAMYTGPMMGEQNILRAMFSLEPSGGFPGPFSARRTAR